MSCRTLRFEVAAASARIVLDRPDAANAPDLIMAEALFDAALGCAGDDRIRSVLSTGEGRMVCAGGDLKRCAAAGDAAPRLVTEVATLLHNVVTRFVHMDAPLVVAVDGTAAGAGFSLALSGDHVLASDAARFVSACTASGLSPDGSSTCYLARHIGLLRAKEPMLACRMLSAEEAPARGLVTRVVPAADLMTEAEAMTRSFASGETRA